jgi:hypothetical protein
MTRFLGATRALAFLATLAIACTTPPSRPPADPPAAEATRWENGRWFDGARFVSKTMYSARGVFLERPPARVTRTVDLDGGFVVPPFGDAHHHGIDAEAGLDAKVAAFLGDGIFYVKNPNVIPDLLTPAVRARLARTDGLDVSFSNGGLTSTGGHPSRLHDILARRGVFPGLGPADMENRAYFFIDSDADLAAKWPRILGGKPDFIKVFLSFCNGQEHPDGWPPGSNGLDPRLVPSIVARAHAAGLRVSAHITTALDFAAAVDAGVDEINHLPIFLDADYCRDHPASCRIDAATAQRAAARHVVAVTTLAPHSGGDDDDTETIAARIDAQRANFTQLATAGVTIALGSDGISGEQPFVTALGEAWYLHENRFADNLTLLKMWSETTPWTIFPARRIGHLAPGYEASFLVLDGDPIADFSQVKRIRRRVRAGRDVERP